MRNKILKTIGLGCLGLLPVLSLTSCEDFLDRPTEDNPTAVDFYKSETELKQALNPLYCIAWFDFQRMWIDAGDVLAGNYGKGSSNIYTNLNTSTASTNDILTNGYGALNAVVSMANIAMTNIDAYSTLDKDVVNKYKGEAMVMKAMAYFYIVRLWGQSPIIDDNVKIIGEGKSYDLTKNTEEDIYKYIITVLQKAAEYLPESNDAGRVDKYSAYGLLSKVYLYYACFKGKDSHLLDQSLKYAELVKNSSHGSLEPVYGKLFRHEGETSPESLITLHWSPTYSPYPSININHCDMGCAGLNETGAWGQWNYVTIDLMNLFGVNSFDPNVKYGEPSTRPDSYKDAELTVASGYDVRRAATMALYHDYIPFWQRDKEIAALGKKGFYVTWNCGKEDSDNKVDVDNGLEWVFPSGAAPVKQIHGSIADHIAEYNCTPDGQGSCTPMILLRTADVYLCASEAAFHKGDMTTAKEYMDIVRTRAGVGEEEYSLSMDFYLDERRREMAFEGDNYYDLRRWAYFDVASASAYILGQERNSRACGWLGGDGDMISGFKNPAEDVVKPNTDIRPTVIPSTAKGGISDGAFLLPFPDKDIAANPNLAGEPQPYDFSQLGYYDETKL
ncbi:MAG: RagB/SusD family nutrient uptake outer membrane protein [Bacteroidales bacterium]|nr:RagB/SusD family nutrient uptake outer membrane protein [Bacteroidales bacterium]